MNRSTLPRWARTARTRTIALVASGALAVGALGACSTAADDVGSSTASSTSSTGTTTDGSTQDEDVISLSSSGLTAAEVLAENLDASETVALADAEWDAGEEVAVDLDSPAAAEGVEVDGETVTVTAPGTYRLSGTLAGQVVVSSEADGVVRLVLDGADITSSTGAAVDVQDADQVSVVLADGSTNRLEDATEYADTESENAANATLYSTADMAISGSGALEVVGNANDGITGKDGLAITAGDITVTADDDGVRGKDYLVVTGGTLDVSAGGDGLKSDDDSDATAGYVALLGGDVTVAAGSDGAQGFTDVAIDGGTLTVTESEEGIEAAVIAVSGGTVDVTASDDALNATVKEADEATETAGSTDSEQADETEQAGPGGGGGSMAVQAGASLTVTGGTVRAVAGADGFDSNGVVEITGGDLVVEGASGGGGDGAIDANGTTTVSGGTLVAVGNTSSGAVDSTQGWVTLTDAVPAGSTVEVASDDGTVEATAVVTTASTVALTADGIAAGESYTVTVDGEPAGTVTAEEAPTSSMGGTGGGRGGQPPAEGELPEDGQPPSGTGA